MSHSRGGYDYLYRDSETADKVIKDTNDGTKRDFWFEYAEWYISVWYKIKGFFKHKYVIEVIIGTILIILGLLIAGLFKDPS